MSTLLSLLPLAVKRIVFVTAAASGIMACNAASFKMAGSKTTGATAASGVQPGGGDDALAKKGDETKDADGNDPDKTPSTATAVLKANDSDGMVNVPAGSEITLSWSSEGATDCLIKPINGTGLSGSAKIKVEASQTFTMLCNTPGGPVTDDVTVLVTPAAAPSVGITANGTKGAIVAKPNDMVKIAWDSKDATACTVSPGGFTGVSGSADVKMGTAPVVYIASCTGPGGTMQDTVVINVNPPGDLLADLTVNGTNVAVYVPYLATVELFWTSAGADVCRVDPIADTRLSATLTTAKMTASTVFVLTCSNKGGAVMDAIAVNVGNPSPAKPDLKINGSDGPVIAAAGTPLALTWTSVFSNSCSLQPAAGTTAPLDPSGNVATTAGAAITVYILTCDGPGGQGVDTVQVLPAVTPPSAAITANGKTGIVTVPVGSNVTLAWTSTAAASCFVTPGGYTGIAGTKLAGPVNERKDYVVLCDGPYGAAAASVTVVPQTAGLAVTLVVNGSSNPITVAKDSPLSISWTSTDAVSCKIMPFDFTGLTGTNKATPPVTADLTVVLTCLDSGGGSESAQVPVKVISTPGKGAYVDLKANGSDGPLYIEEKKPVQLVWTSHGTTSCRIADSIDVATSGAKTVSITGDVRLKIVCKTAGVDVSDAVQVYVRHGGKVSTKVGINFEDTLPGYRDGDFNDFTICATHGDFTIYGSEVVSNKAQWVPFTTSQISACAHTVKIQITHADGTKEAAVVFDSRTKPALNLYFKEGSTLDVYMTPLTGCSDTQTRSQHDPIWAIVKADECRRTGN